MSCNFTSSCWYDAVWPSVTARPFSRWDESQGEQNRGQARSSTPVLAGQWAKKLSSIGTSAVTLARLSSWNQLSVSEAAGHGMCWRAWRQWHSPGQQDQQSPVTVSTAASLTGAPITISSLVSPGWRSEKEAVITGHRHLLGQTSVLRPNGRKPKGLVQYPSQSRLSYT